MLQRCGYVSRWKHTTRVRPAVMQGSIQRCSMSSTEWWENKYEKSTVPFAAPARSRRDVIVIGAGHNGLVSAAYLAKAGLDTLVLERRHCIGGATVTEEIVPGYKFSRASYLAGLLRPQIIKDLELEKHGFKYLVRDPSSFTPTTLDSKYGGKYLLLGSDERANYESISQFSKRDADAYPKYEEFLGKVREILQPLLDAGPPDPFHGGFHERMSALKTISSLASLGIKHRQILLEFYELMVGPAQQILDRWFESDILKATLATDAVIGALISPQHNGSAYVLLHHVMGEAAGRKGVWAYVEGGMGAVSHSIAAAARAHGAEIATSAAVRRILCNGRRAVGVEMSDGTRIHADTVIAACTPYHAFAELLQPEDLSGLPAGPEYLAHIRAADYSCGSVKINCAVDRLPGFACFPSPPDGRPGPMHRGTAHFESSLDEIHRAYLDAAAGRPAARPVIEMTIPSAVDTTLAPSAGGGSGGHVVQLFVQYAPYDLDRAAAGGTWSDAGFKESFADRCFRVVEDFCPGFTQSVIARDVLSPLDLERLFGLHKGSISHGALGLHQLAYARPVPFQWPRRAAAAAGGRGAGGGGGGGGYKTPVGGLYLGSAGTHPGGGVMGAAGRNCAAAVLWDLGRA